MNEILTGPANYFDRAYQIAEDLNCKVWLEEDIYPQYFWDNDPEVFAPPPTNQFRFLVLVHELGHIRLKHVQEIASNSTNLWIPQRIPGSYFTNGILRSEVQAWEFALSNLHELLEENSRYWIRFYLQTYLTEAERSKGRLWQIYRPAKEKGKIWVSPPFKFDSPDYALDFLVKVDELMILNAEDFE